MALPRLFQTYNSKQRGKLRAAGSYKCHSQHLDGTVLCACLKEREESIKNLRVQEGCHDIFTLQVCYNGDRLPMQPEPWGLGMKSPSHSQRYVPISFMHRPLMHIPVTEHSSISGNK